MNVELKLDVKLLPQLIVMSAITESPAGGGPFIENRCVMVSDPDELHAEIEQWRQEIEAEGYKIINAVATYVPKSVYGERP